MARFDIPKQPDQILNGSVGGWCKGENDISDFRSVL